MTQPRSTGRAGFLLAETMITFALSALVLVGLASATAALLRATDKSMAIVGATDDLGRTLAALRRDLAGLKRARWNGDEPQNFVFRGGPNSLYFALETPRSDGGRLLRVVSLREVRKGRAQALERSEAPLPVEAGCWGELRFGPPARVPTGRARLRFRYLAEAAPGAPVPATVDSWPAGPTLPAAVLVEAVDAASALSIATARIAIRADGDIGCADRSRAAVDSAPPQGPSAAGLPATGLLAPSPQGPGGLDAQPGRPPAPGAGAGQLFQLTSQSTTANNNEFCGRADRGVASRRDAPAPPFPGTAETAR